MSNKQLVKTREFVSYLTSKLNSREKKQVEENLGISLKKDKILIPTIISNEIKGYAESENLLRKHGDVVPIEPGSLRYPILLDGLETTVNGAEIVKLNTLNLSAVILEPVEFSITIPIGKRILTMSSMQINDAIIDLMKEYYLRKEIDYMYNGNSENKNNGSLYNGSILMTPTSTDTLKAIKELKNKLTTRVLNKSRWMVNARALTMVEDICLPNGKAALTTNDDTESGVKYYLLGFPLDCTDDIVGDNPDKAIFYFGDFKSFKIRESIGELECNVNH